MSLRILRDGSDDVMCPHCNQAHGYEWDDGEYNTPEVGEHQVECAKCEKKFTVSVSINYFSFK